MLPNSVNVDVAVLKAILKKACSWGQLVNDPGKDVKLLKVTQRKTRFLSEEEEGALFAVCSLDLRRIIEVGLLTGFRRRELISLRPDDVDLVRETVTVAAANSKNGESRTLPMGPRLKTLFREALKIRGAAPTALTEENEPWGYRAFADRFQKACGEASVELLSPHVLRHTFASRLVMAGVDLRTVQELMGHKNILMTMRYAHLSPDHKRMAMETLESRFPAKSPAIFHNTRPMVPSEEQKKRVRAR